MLDKVECTDLKDYRSQALRTIGVIVDIETTQDVQLNMEQCCRDRNIENAESASNPRVYTSAKFDDEFTIDDVSVEFMFETVNRDGARKVHVFALSDAEEECLLKQIDAYATDHGDSLIDRMSNSAVELSTKLDIEDVHDDVMKYHIPEIVEQKTVSVSFSIAGGVNDLTYDELMLMSENDYVLESVINFERQHPAEFKAEMN